MRVRQLFCLLLCLGVTRPAYSQKSPALSEQKAPRPLEIRLTKPLAWKNYCLQVSITRINRSKSPIFLPFFGIAIYSSVTDATNSLGQGKGEAWIIAHGNFGISSSDVTRLGPGEARHDVYCIGDTVPVVNHDKKMRRQVRVQGHLRISASYLPEAQEWQISKAQREEMMLTPPSKWKNADRSNGGSVALEVPIPCPRGVSQAECGVPPPVFDGESAVMIPDIGGNE